MTYAEISRHADYPGLTRLRHNGRDFTCMGVGSEVREVLRRLADKLARK